MKGKEPNLPLHRLMLSTPRGAAVSPFRPLFMSRSFESKKMIKKDPQNFQKKNKYDEMI